MTNARRRSTSSGRSELARLLIDIRGDRQQAVAAARAGLTQAKISRAERDLFPLSPEEASGYATANGATPAQRRRLVELCEAEASIRAAASHTSLVRVAAAIQERTRALVEAATAIHAWESRLILGNLQTPAYTEAMLAGDGEGDPGPVWWAARRARVAMLDDPSRTWHQILSEATLRWGIGSPQIMAEQIDHITQISRRAHVRIGVVPLDTVHLIAAPAGFHLYHEPLKTTVEVGGRLGAVFRDGPGDVASFLTEFAQLEKFAVYDEDARKLIARIKRKWTRP